MVVFQIESELLKKMDAVASREQSVFAATLQVKNETFYHEQSRQSYVFISSLNEGRLVAAAITRSRDHIDQAISEYLQATGIRHSAVTIKEITLKTLQSLLRIAVRNRFIDDDDIILERFNLSGLTGRFTREISFEEMILNCDRKKGDLIKEAAGLLTRSSLVPEIKRIYDGTKDPNVYGHPVHYLIRTDSADVRDKMTTILLTSLLHNNRIKNRRYCSISLDIMSDVPGKQYELMYESCFGGAILVCLSELENDAGEYISMSSEVIKQVCRIAQKYRKDVLTVFCFPGRQQDSMNILNDYLDDMTLIILSDETIFGEQAKAYLRNLARNYNIYTNDELFRHVNDEGKGFLAADLNLEFDKWFGEQLKKRVYPQYSDFKSIYTKAASEQPKGSAYSKLMNLIGLREPKEMIVQALNYTKAQKLYRSKGMETGPLPMHMVFTGNPGTAKTTVARLFAQIMKDNGILRAGNLLEVGRADLVGKYVGWTAKMVKEKFKAASGSVLFIDEAYSLVDDREGMYGDEAINTIVQEMENRRGDTVVIFAGYPDKMTDFLNRNPGLRSRIGFNISFSDYSADELWGILECIASGMHMNLALEVKTLLMPLLMNMRKENNFGNGRYVRNLFDKARLRQASRILKHDPDSLSREDMLMLLPEDFDMMEDQSQKSSPRMIGFM